MSSEPRSDSDFLDDLIVKFGDPLDSRQVLPPFEEIFSRLDGQSPADSARDLSDLAFALREILRWLAVDRRGNPLSQVAVQRRAIALLWLVAPGDFDGTPSLSELARRVGADKVALSIHSADARRRFGVRNRGCSHAANFSNDQPQPINSDHDHPVDD